MKRFLTYLDHTTILLILPPLFLVFSVIETSATYIIAEIGEVFNPSDTDYSNIPEELYRKHREQYV